ncbi:hypothetical protein PAPYR_7559 [Paratrimastix pyriformis]|uniref:C2H2-type domain-containing protein n=1 Tax=Paratrimastix pyriformis TaxID=342808 RepID=A0ABQ8UGP5_9EUKA|nr:hypothetical protein PAPYR_7559 [Paratrimastix pyriformis]
MEFACAKCDKTYKTAKSLKRHVNEKHSEGGEAANPTPTEQTKPAEPAPADVPESVDDVSMGGDGGDGGDDEFFEQVRADAAFEMTHPDEIDDEPTKRKASTRSAPLDAPPPLPSIPLEEKIEAKKYAQETVTPDSLGTKHPQAISSMRERAEKEHLVAGLAKRLGIKEVQEADLRGMTDVELEAYHSQLRGKVDQKLVDALTHSDVMTDTYIAGVSGLVIAGGRYMKRDTTPVHGQLEANRPAISEAIKDWMRENPEFASNLTPATRLLAVTVASVVSGVMQSTPLDPLKKAPSTNSSQATSPSSSAPSSSTDASDPFAKVPFVHH